MFAFKLPCHSRIIQTKIHAIQSSDGRSMSPSLRASLRRRQEETMQQQRQRRRQEWEQWEEDIEIEELQLRKQKETERNFTQYSPYISTQPTTTQLPPLPPNRRTPSRRSPSKQIVVEQQQQQAADPYMQARMRQKISRFSDLVSTIQRSNADVDPYAPRSSSQQGQQQTTTTTTRYDTRRRRVARSNNNVSLIPPLTSVDRSLRTVPREVEIVDHEGMNVTGMGDGEVSDEDGYYNDYIPDDDNGVNGMEIDAKRMEKEGYVDW